MAIDVHAHCVPATLLDEIRRVGSRIGVEVMDDERGAVVSLGGSAGARVGRRMWDVDARLAWMRTAGIELQVVSPWISLTASAVPGAGAASFARMYNEHLAGVVQAHPDRFQALATIPLQDPHAAAAELRYAVAELEMAGVEIATTVAGRELDDDALEPVWAMAEELQCLVLLHPFDALAGRDLHRYGLHNVVGNPAETTVAVAHLIFGGVLERHPRLQLCLVHGGGFAPYQVGRWDHAVRHDVRGAAQNLTRLPSEWLREMYFDTVTHGPLPVELLVAQLGADRVVLGSDYPFDMGESDPVSTVNQLAGLSDRDRDLILQGTARGLLAGLRRSPQRE
jgi:aminocarboxymuconate-semialdehyde decarboxylase